jgi:Fe-S-cluster containining protein
MRVRLPLLDDDARAQLARLHLAVDTMTAPLVALHGARLQCKRGCHACCVDGLTVFALEAAQIAEHHVELLESGEPGAEGACAFLDLEGACRIYAQRPYVCRTQGLPLRSLEERDDEIIELRNVCALNLVDTRDASIESPMHETPLGALPAAHCFTLGPVEERLREQAEQADATQRIPLRSLFSRSA